MRGAAVVRPVRRRGVCGGGQTGPVVAAVTFTWLGMVLAISFLEAPLKFRAPGITVPLGLLIGVGVVA